MKTEKLVISQVLSWEGNSFCKEPFVHWKFGSRVGGQSEFQLDSANYSYSKMNQGTNPFCSEDKEKGEEET